MGVGFRRVTRGDHVVRGDVTVREASNAGVSNGTLSDGAPSNGALSDTVGPQVVDEVLENVHRVRSDVVERYRVVAAAVGSLQTDDSTVHTPYTHCTATYTTRGVIHATR